MVPRRCRALFTNLFSVISVGLVREQEAGLQAFVSHDGFSVLMRGMQSENEKVRTKSAFLLLNLLTSNPEHKGVKERRATLMLMLSFNCFCYSFWGFHFSEKYLNIYNEYSHFKRLSIFTQMYQ